MQRNRIILFFIGFFLSFGAAAANLDFNLSDEAFLVRYMQSPVNGGMQLDFGALHQEDDINVGSVGLHLVDNAGTQGNPLQVGLGGRLMAIDSDAGSGAAIAVGAWARYHFPAANRFAIAGDIHYAPSVTTFSDIDKYMELSVRGEYEVLRNGSLYLGYRRVRADFEGFDNVDLDKGLHVGMHFTF